MASVMLIIAVRIVKHRNTYERYEHIRAFGETEDPGGDSGGGLAWSHSNRDVPADCLRELSRAGGNAARAMA